MLKWLIGGMFMFFFLGGIAQDSVRVVIELEPYNDKYEIYSGYDDARENLDVKMALLGFKGGEHVAHTFHLVYDIDENAWVSNLPQGMYNLHIKSLGFSEIKSSIELKKDHQETFYLKLDSVSYTYKNKKRYNYIAGTLNFSETLVVQFKDGDPSENRAFLVDALANNGMDYLNVLRIQKLRITNGFLVTLDIADQTALNMILYRKITKQPEIERGYLIGGLVTKAIETYQENENILYANPSFLNDPTQTFRTSANYTQSEQLERKLLSLMEEDPKKLDKINYIIEKTTTKEPTKEEK